MDNKKSNPLGQPRAAPTTRSIWATLDERKAFVNFTEADARELASLKGWADVNMPHVADGFYNRLKQFETPMRIIREAGSTLERLAKTMAVYLGELWGGNYDQAYFERRYQIGVRHDLIGLTPRWYIGGYSIHFQNMVPRLVARYWWQPAKLTRILLALNKILNLDEQIAIDTYFDLRASKVASASTEIAATSKDVSRGARQQSDEVVRSAAAMEEMAASIATVSKNAAATLDAAQSATERARLGEQAIIATTSGIEEANVTAQRLRERSETIGKVVLLIEGIANQTNILALNAAIEAAGAGEAGARFDVVAEEIRKLARRTAESTAEITKLIHEVQTDTQQVVAAIGSGVQSANMGRESIAEVVAGIQDVQDRVGQIVASAREQARTSGEVAQSLSTLAEASQQISTATNQAATATEDLSKMVDQLKG